MLDESVADWAATALVNVVIFLFCLLSVADTGAANASELIASVEKDPKRLAKASERICERLTTIKIPSEIHTITEH